MKLKNHPSLNCTPIVRHNLTAGDAVHFKWVVFLFASQAWLLLLFCKMLIFKMEANCLQHALCCAAVCFHI